MIGGRPRWLAWKNPWLQEESPAEATPTISCGPSSTERQFARYLPRFQRMSEQLRQTSTQIENSVVDVCASFQDIAQRARQMVTRTTGFLSGEGGGTHHRQSFEALFENCSQTLIKILRTTEEGGETARRAIERIQLMDKASEKIIAALEQMEQIARDSLILAVNARIEAARAGDQGAGFAVVAFEVVTHTTRSQKITADVSQLILGLRVLAKSTLQDLQRMNAQESEQVEQCRQEVNESLGNLKLAHSEMAAMLNGMTDQSSMLANEIAAAVRGLQFQDRTSQRIAHVIEDLDTMHTRVSASLEGLGESESSDDEGFSAYTMHEERNLAGIAIAESCAGDVELF